MLLDHVFDVGAPRRRMSAARLLVAAAVAVTVAVPAAASITYLGTRSIGAGSVDLSITTDGRTGVLAAADVLAWTVTLHDPTSAFPLRTLTSDGTGGSLRSTVVIAGSAVSATPSALSFTYGLGDLEFDANFTVRPFYQLVSTACSTGYFGEVRACEQFDTGSDYASQHVQYVVHPVGETVVIATAAATGAVPEPAAWALMVVGFGLVGAMRRRRVVVLA